jgi:hypothetical protein
MIGRRAFITLLGGAAAARRSAVGRSRLRTTFGTWLPRL